jgi:predicted AlkP superfamily pyrophosphatase or phosphodiesterase
MRKSALAGITASILITAWPAQAEIKHVLHITVDGLRGDLLNNLINSAPASYPNFIKLRDEGASTFNARCDYDYSETIPNHSGIVTGRPVLDPPGQTGVAHNYTSNGYVGTGTTGDTIHKLGTAPLVYKFSTFDMAHDRGLSTALYGGKTRVNLLVDSYSATRGAPDLILPDHGRNKVDFASVADLSSSATGFTTSLDRVKIALLANINGNTLRNYSLIHFTDTDTGATGGGHNAGWGTASWNTAVRAVDDYLGAILTAIAANPNYHNKTAVVLTADHGGGGGSGTGGGLLQSHADPSSALNYTIPLMIWGPGVPPGKDVYTLFKNRQLPRVTAVSATDRPSAAANVVQPLRNTDTGNIAMALLGLPAITGSYFKPALADGPTIEQDGSNVIVKWPAYLTGYLLQTTTDLVNGPWENDPIPPIDNTTFYSRTIADPAALDPKRFYRLKSP